MTDRLKCTRCSDEITWGEFKYSMHQFNEQLCQDCQKKVRIEKYPSKLASFLNKELGKTGTSNL